MEKGIKKQLISGVFYIAIAKYSGIIISLIITAVLARLISPDDFGVVAIATVIIAFFGLFTDIGISPAIIQHKELTKKDLSNIFSFTFWIGISLTILFYLASWAIADFYNNPTLKILCQLLSINLFFATINIVPNALFYKNKEFKFISIRSFSIQLLCGIFAIGAAFWGAKLYALIITPILSSILVFFISIYKYPQSLSLTFGINTIKKIFSYSIYQFLFNIICYFSRNIDKLLIGKHMGMVLLGYYEKSYRLMMLPLQNITQVITPVMHPIFSDYQNDLNQLAISYEKIIKILAFIGFPLSVLLYFTAHEAVLIIFGNQWVPSISIFKILSLSVGTQIILSSSGSIFQASNDTRSLFICGLFSSILNVGGIILGVFYFNTLNAIAWIIVLTFTINFIQCYFQMYIVTFKRSPLFFFSKLISPFIISIITAVILHLLNKYLDNDNIVISAILKFSVSFTIFGVYIQLTNEFNIIKYFQNKIKHR